VNAFAAALATLVADPNLGMEAQWQRGDDPPLALRVLRAAPDQVVTSFGVGAITATDVLSVPVAVLPDIQPGDRFLISGDTLTVQSALRDASGTAWRIACQREE
jgi:hypothetical protein